MAALWVLLFHFREIGTNWDYHYPVLDDVMRRGYLGVDVFFILSGFILTHVYQLTFREEVRWADWSRFLQFRFARIYPLHLVTLAVMLVIGYISMHKLGVMPKNAFVYTGISVLSNLFLVQAWFPGVVGSPNTPAWSISAEWFAYLLFPAICWMAARLGQVAWIAVAIGAISLTHWGDEQTPLIQIAGEFILGVLLYRLHGRRTLPGVLEPFGASLAVLAVGASVYFLNRHVTWIQIVLFAAMIIFLANSRDLLARVLSHRWLVFAGEVSYSVYMCHWLVWSVVKHGSRRAPAWVMAHPPVIVVTALVLTGLVAVPAYFYIELPGRTWLRRLGSWNRSLSGGTARRVEAGSVR